MPFEVPGSSPGRSNVCAYIYLNRKFLTPSLTSLFKNEVENGTLKLRASDERNWPSFLYPENTRYNELELDKGLFRGHVFIRVCSSALARIFSFPGDIFKSLRAIFTGKSSAFTGYRSASKRSQAELHKMREVFPEAVAYAAVQVGPSFCLLASTNLFLQCYYALSSLEGWDREDRFFKLDLFFDKCVQLFGDDPEDEWVTDTLKFLTRYFSINFVIVDT